VYIDIQQDAEHGAAGGKTGPKNKKKTKNSRKTKKSGKP